MGDKVAIVPLGGANNYSTWAVQCRMALLKEDLWSVVSTPEPPDPATATAASVVQYQRRQEKALATIVLTINPSLLYLLPNPEDPAVVWQQLRDHFQKRTWSNKLHLRRQLNDLRLAEGGSLSDHIKQVTELFSGLAIVGDAVAEEDQVVTLLSSLPRSYDVLVTALEARVDALSMDELKERLHHEATKRDRSIGGSGEVALAAKCFYCDRPGHIKRDCRKRLADEQRRNDTTRGPGIHNRSHENQHTAKVLLQVAEEERNASSGDENVAFHAKVHGSEEEERNEAWLADSGASSHMTHQRESFSEYNALSQPEKVLLGDGRSVQAVGKGTIRLQVLLEGQWKKRYLNNVLHVPALAYNLLSISVAATKQHKEITFKGSQCYIRDSMTQLLSAVGTATPSGLYLLDCRSEAQPTSRVHVQTAAIQNDTQLWHKRFGHLGIQNLKRLVTQRLVKGLNSDLASELPFCGDCQAGKLTRLPFPSSQTTTEQPLELVHSDVCGKVTPTSLGGSQYFLTFTDDYSKYTHVYLIKHKDEVFSRFKSYQRLAEKETGHQLKALRTDNGGEYTSREFTSYLQQEGVDHQFTVPKTPEQNGVAERLNRTILDKARTMMADVSLPKHLWAEAVHTAVYLKNRSPSASKAKTPFELYYGSMPNIGHLKVFGCAVYAHIPRDERRKFDSKARKCWLVGYSTSSKGFRLYDSSRSRVILSRDVIFNENEQYSAETQLRQPPATTDTTPRVIIPATHTDAEDENNVEALVEQPVQAEDAEAGNLRRSGRERRAPDRYGEWVMLSQTETPEPRTMAEALKDTNAHLWKDAAQKEYDSLIENGTWELVDLPVNRKAVDCKWVFRIKRNEDGSIERYKARLVAKGFTQKFGVDYDETFSPVVRFESVRLLIALASQLGMKLHQMDVTSAFLNGSIKEEIYMKQPEGFEMKDKENKFCRLKKSLYGLKQSPRCWNETLHRELCQLGYRQSDADPCIYTQKKEESLVFLAVYVDDIIVASRSEKELEEIKKELSEKFKMRDLGRLHYFLGIKINQGDGTIWIGQQGYTEKLLQKYNMENSNPVAVPMDPNCKLTKATNGSQPADQVLYQSAVGSLLYLAIATRPDIAVSVGIAAKFSANPTQEHWNAVKRIFRYLKGTSNFGLLYKNNNKEKLHGFSDADWAGDEDDRRSTSGMVFKLAGGAISWRSKKQTVVALSTAEAEYVALAAATQEATWLRQLMKSFQQESTEEAIVIYEDNQSALAIASNAVFHGRTKHIGIKFHYTRQQLEKEVIKLIYCPTDRMQADILTKAVGKEAFQTIRSALGLVATEATTEKEC